MSTENSRVELDWCSCSTDLPQSWGSRSDGCRAGAGSGTGASHHDPGGFAKCHEVVRCSQKLARFPREFGKILGGFADGDEAAGDDDDNRDDEAGTTTDETDAILTTRAGGENRGVA